MPVVEIPMDLFNAVEQTVEPRDYQADRMPMAFMENVYAPQPPGEYSYMSNNDPSLDDYGYNYSDYLGYFEDKGPGNTVLPASAPSRTDDYMFVPDNSDYIDYAARMQANNLHDAVASQAQPYPYFRYPETGETFNPVHEFGYGINAANTVPELLDNTLFHEQTHDMKGQYPRLHPWSIYQEQSPYLKDRPAYITPRNSHYAFVPLSRRSPYTPQSEWYADYRGFGPDMLDPRPGTEYFGNLWDYERGRHY